MPIDQISYSEKYTDEFYEYRQVQFYMPLVLGQVNTRTNLRMVLNRSKRHVILPPDITKLVPKNHLMTETEWRNLGVQQSPGWVHYMVHSPEFPDGPFSVTGHTSLLAIFYTEPHVLLFRRALPKAQSNSQSTLTQSHQVAAH